MFKVDSISIILFGESFTFYRASLCNVLENVARVCNTKIENVTATHNSTDFTGTILVHGKQVGTYKAII